MGSPVRNWCFFLVNICPMYIFLWIWYIFEYKLKWIFRYTVDGLNSVLDIIQELISINCRLETSLFSYVCSLILICLCIFIYLKRLSILLKDSSFYYKTDGIVIINYKILYWILPVIFMVVHKKEESFHLDFWYYLRNFGYYLRNFE